MPVWHEKIMLGDLFHNEDMSFEQRRDEIVRRLRASRWHDGEDYEVESIIEELAETEDEDAFDAVWDLVYDFADEDRVWIDTFEPSRVS